MAKIKNQNLIIVGGKEPVLQEKSVEITENGTTTYIADDGFDGLKSLEVTTNVAGSGGGGSSELSAFIDGSFSGTNGYYEIPNDITNVNEYVFRYMNNIKRLKINNNITTAGAGAFALPYGEEIFYDGRLPNYANYSSSCLNNLGSAEKTHTCKVIIGANATQIPSYFITQNTYMSVLTNEKRTKNLILNKHAIYVNNNGHNRAPRIWLELESGNITFGEACIYRASNAGVGSVFHIKADEIISNTNGYGSGKSFYSYGSSTGVIADMDVKIVGSNVFGEYNSTYKGYWSNMLFSERLTEIKSNGLRTTSTKLTHLTFLSPTAPSLASSGALPTNTTYKIYVPAESLTAYQSATNWSAIADRIIALTYTNYTDGTNSVSLGNNMWFNLNINGSSLKGTYTLTEATGAVSLRVCAEDYIYYNGTITDNVLTITVEGTTYTLNLET